MSTLIDRDNELKFLKNMTDDQAYANALSDPDNPPLTEEQLATVVRLRDVPGETKASRQSRLALMPTWFGTTGPRERGISPS